MARPLEGDPAQRARQQQQELLVQFGRMMDGWRPQEARVGGILVHHLTAMGAIPVDRSDMPVRYRIPQFDLRVTGLRGNIRVGIHHNSFHLGSNHFDTTDLGNADPEAVTNVFGHSLDFLRQRQAAVYPSASESEA